MDKVAERTEDGNLYREIIGVYFNFQVKFGWSYGDEESEREYDNLWEVLTEPVDYHTAELPYGRRGSHAFKCYISNVQDGVMVIDRQGNQYWNGLTANFIAKEPARTPSMPRSIRTIPTSRTPGDYLRR